MECYKTVDPTSSMNSVSDTMKFESFPISLCNEDNKDKSLSLSIFTTSKEFQGKETDV